MTAQRTAQPGEKPERKARRGRPPRASARETRLELLRSAAREFSRREYSEVRLEAIANNVGLTSTAIYNHFSSKDALFFATIRHMMRINIGAIEVAIGSADGWRGQLRAVLHLIKTDQTGWLRFPLLISAAQLKSQYDPQRSSEILRLREAYASLFASIVTSGIKAGDLPKSISVKPTAELLMAFVFNGLGAAMSHCNEEEEVARLIEGFEALTGLACDEPDK
ncbi:MAG: TetR/AcrR family transcriptional regulator [Erythrobacter sp.]